MQIRSCAACPKTGLFPNSEWRGIKKAVRVICKSCYYKEYAIAHKETIAETKMKWIRVDPVRFKATQNRYVLSGKASESRKKLIARNPFEYSRKAVERANKAREKNPVRHAAYQSAYQRVRRALLMHPINTKYLALVTKVYEQCPENLTVDHIIPLKNPHICGLHVPWNLQYLPQYLNSQKSNSFDSTYSNEGWKHE